VRAYGYYFEIFAYHAGKKRSRRDPDLMPGAQRHTLRKRIKVPAYALINQARANFQNGRLTIEMPLRSIKV
jgi:HSP20 family molecular chaperone IbpA